MAALEDKKALLLLLSAAKLSPLFPEIRSPTQKLWSSSMINFFTILSQILIACFLIACKAELVEPATKIQIDSEKNKVHAAVFCLLSGLMRSCR